MLGCSIQPCFNVGRQDSRARWQRTAPDRLCVIPDPPRLESRSLTAWISSSFSFHGRSSSLAASRFRTSTASYCSKAFLASYSSCSNLRYVVRRRQRLIPPSLADWLPPPKARSPVARSSRSRWSKYGRCAGFREIHDYRAQIALIFQLRRNHCPSGQFPSSTVTHHRGIEKRCESRQDPIIARPFAMQFSVGGQNRGELSCYGIVGAADAGRAHRRRHECAAPAVEFSRASWQHAVAPTRVRGEGLRWPATGIRVETRSVLTIHRNGRANFIDRVWLLKQI
jgi:hypothetical protein